MDKSYQDLVDKKINDIKSNPGAHRHTYTALHQCCMINGVLDSKVMQAHEDHAYVGTNGGQNCDVTSGPCSCGAWH